MAYSNRPHLSPSAMRMWNRCGEQFRFRYIENIKKVPLGAALVLGRTAHEAVEENFKWKWRTGECKPTEEILDVFSAQYDRLLDTEEVRFWKDERDEYLTDPGKLKDEGVKCVTVHSEKLAPYVTPGEEPEQWFRVDMGGSRDLLGKTDIVDIDGIIIDQKFEGKKQPADEVAKDIQFSAYARSRMDPDKVDPNAFVELRRDSVLRSTKTMGPRAVQTPVRRTAEQLKRFNDLFHATEEAIDKGAFVPKTEGWHCSEKWCGFWNLCKHGGKK